MCLGQRESDQQLEILNDKILKFLKELQKTFAIAGTITVKLK